jgi:DNA-binding PadR family transcriptional regulator
MAKKLTKPGEFEELLMLVVQSLGEEASGMGIYEALEQIGRKTSPGAVYATADRLIEKGFLKTWEATDPQASRTRRYFAITGAGVSALNEAEAERNAARNRFKHAQNLTWRTQ